VRVRYEDEALEEAMKAADWYEVQEEGLANHFITKWKEAENRMVFAPELNRIFADDLRVCRFEIFPFKMIYRIVDGDTLQVISVMYMKRHPDYWKERLQN
jgi:ParE toxin of type II toxin-antitoxin system, parDE